MELTQEKIISRRQHLQGQSQNVMNEINRLQAQYQAIDGALQDVLFWENEVNNDAAEREKERQAEREKQQALSNKLDVALAHQEGLNDGIASRDSQTRPGRKASKRR